MKKKQFEAVPPEYEGHKTGGNYKYSTGAFVRDGILAVDFYESRSGVWRAMWRTLISEKEFCNYDYENKLWSGEQIDTAGSKHMKLNTYRAGIVFENQNKLLGGAEKTIKDFIRQTGGYIYSYIWDCLKYREGKIAEEKREAAEERKHIRIQKKMALVPPVPADFESFIREKLFRHDHIMYVSKEKAVCSRCGREMVKDRGMKHNAEGNCPFCGKKVTYKSTGRMSEHETKKEVLLIQKWENDVILRYFKCSLYSVNEKKENMQYAESIRTYHNKCIEWYDKRYVHYADLGGEFWSETMNMYYPVAYGRCCLYDGNLPEIEDLLGERAYLPVKELAEEGIVLPWKDILQGQKIKNRIFEKLYKAGLKKLAVEYMRSDNIGTDYTQRELKKCLMITGPMFNYMCTNNSGKKVLEVFQDAKEDNCGLNDREIFELAEAGIKVSELKRISEKRKLIKMLHYLEKAKGYSGLKNTYSHYTDYIGIIQAMDYDMEKDTVRYPADLKSAHDKAVEAFYKGETDKRKQEALRKYPGIQKLKKELDERYGYRDREYMITAPEDAADIVEEGRALHHCVGRDNYLRKHDTGYTFIFFLRRAEEPGERYCTIELDPKDNRIIQWYGYNDKKTDKEQVDKVLDKWKRQLRRKEEPEETAAAG